MSTRTPVPPLRRRDDTPGEKFRVLDCEFRFNEAKGLTIFLRLLPTGSFDDLSWCSSFDHTIIQVTHEYAVLTRDDAKRIIIKYVFNKEESFQA